MMKEKTNCKWVCISTGVQVYKNLSPLVVFRYKFRLALRHDSVNA